MGPRKASSSHIPGPSARTKYPPADDIRIGTQIGASQHGRQVSAEDRHPQRNHRRDETEPHRREKAQKHGLPIESQVRGEPLARPPVSKDKREHSQHHQSSEGHADQEDAQQDRDR
jgi:hypothetical protein